MSTSDDKIVAKPEIKSTPRQFVTLCGRIFRDADPTYFPSTIYRGRKIYFCTESCLGAFLSEPEKFYKAHRNSDKKKRKV